MRRIATMLLALLLCAATLAEYPAFDVENVTVTLNNGVKMPIFGIGTYALSSEQAENSVYWALRDGYRLIPGSTNPDHIFENISIFDFELTDDEMAQMTALDRDDRFADY